MIGVVVACATPSHQLEIPLMVEPSCTVALAIRRSGILNVFPQLDFATLRVGLWGKLVPLDALVYDGARIELYRPLTIDPKAARRLRVSGGEACRLADKLGRRHPAI